MTQDAGKPMTQDAGKPMHSFMESIYEVGCNEDPLILIYGPPGIGKTSLAAEFPEPFFILTENSVPKGLKLKARLVGDWQGLRQTLRSLITEDHPFKTVVIDSITTVQQMFFNEVLKKDAANCLNPNERKTSIEAFPYGAGYKFALKYWNDFIRGINRLRDDRGVTVILIGHSRVEKFEDPFNVSYDRHTLDIHHKAVNLIELQMDVILFIAPDFSTQTKGGGNASKICMYTTETPAHIAKNRYGMESKIAYEKGKGYRELKKFLPGKTTIEEVVPVEVNQEPSEPEHSVAEEEKSEDEF